MPHQTSHLDIPQLPQDAQTLATTSADEQAVERNNRLVMIFAVLAIIGAVGTAIGLSAL